MQAAKFRWYTPQEGLLCVWKLHQKTKCNQQNGLLKDYFTSFLTLTWTKTTGGSIIQLLEIFFFFYGICSVRSVHSAWKVWSVQDIQFDQVIGKENHCIENSSSSFHFSVPLFSFLLKQTFALCPKISIPCEAKLATTAVKLDVIVFRGGGRRNQIVQVGQSS